jgi:hypothetical protein
MYQEPFGFRPDGTGPERVPPVMCERCGTDRHLDIRAVTDPPGQYAGVVLVSYICSRCRTFSEHPAQVTDLSMVLARQAPRTDVLIFGWHYLHCGRPMKKTGSELRRLSAPGRLGTDRTLLGVYLPTRVLACRCGFRLELPE